MSEMNTITTAHMTFEEFKKLDMVSMEEMCRVYFRENRDNIKIKKEEVAVKNFVTIIYATLKLSNKKGFQAMSLRDLCTETGLSMGALYSYFSSKEDLLRVIHKQGAISVENILLNQTTGISDPVLKLRSAMRTHLFLSEIMRYWFYFFFMETKNLNKEDQKLPVESELWTEKFFIDIIEEGMKAKVFLVEHVELVTSVIKAMLQDWYLKRWKYAHRKISIDEYADFIIDVIESYILKK